MKKSVTGPLNDILKKVVGALGKKKRSREEMKTAWAEIVGEEGRKHTKPVGFKKNILIVNVDSSSWLYDLTLKKEDILKQLEVKLENRKIKGLRFRIGDIKNNIKEQDGE